MTSSLLIRCDAGAALGLGHLVRCMAIRDELAELNVSSHFVMATGGAEIPSGLGRLGAVHAAPRPGGRLDQADVDAVLRAAEREDSGHVLVDHYGADAKYVASLKQQGLRVAAVDDIHRDLHADWVLDPNIQATRGARRSAVDLRGPRYAPLRPQFAQQRAHLARTFTPADNRVLITLGGGLMHEEVTSALQALGACTSALDVRVLTTMEPDQNMREAAESSPHNVDLVSGTWDVAKHQAWADIAIAAGGSTVWELACMGVPMLVTSYAANQDRNVEALARLGIAIPIPGIHEAASAVKILLGEPARRRIMSERGQRLVDGRGAQRVATSIYRFIKS